MMILKLEDCHTAVFLYISTGLCSRSCASATAFFGQLEKLDCPGFHGWEPLSAFFSFRRQPWSSFTALCLSDWFVCLWHCRMAFETPYRVQAVLKMISMNILVWKAYHPRTLSPHGMVMEVLKQKIHLCIPALQRLLRNIPPFISPPAQVVWELLEAKEGCLQDGKYSLYWFSVQANSHALRQEQGPCAVLWEMSQWAKHAGVRHDIEMRLHQLALLVSFVRAANDESLQAGYYSLE